MACCGAAQPAGPAASRLKEVIVVYKTHFDLGYTALTREVIDRYRTSMIDKALDVADLSKALPLEQRFAWTIPGWPLTQILWDGQAAQRRERVLAALRAGQFVNHALPFTTHTESLDLEDLVRGMGFSSRLARSLDLELPRDAKMTDVPCHSWILPTLLKHAGVDFLHLGSNSMSSGPELPSFGTQVETAPGRISDMRQALFWWEGPDGSRVLTMHSRTYGSSIMPPADWPYPTWLALIHTGDNAGPPAPEAVRKVLEEGRAKLPGVKIRFGRLSDFADALLKENPKLPVIRADMPDPWIYGVMSMPADTARIRETRPLLGMLEALDTLLGIWKATPGATPDIAAAYEQSLLYSEHTWGYDAKRFPRTYGAQWQADRAGGKFMRLEESWDEHRAYSRRAAELTVPRLEAKLRRLSVSVAQPGRRIAVFNSLPWARGGVVKTAFSGVPPHSMSDAETGVLIPVEAKEGELRFLAQNVPALGYRTYTFSDKPAPKRKPGAAANGENVIENRYFRVTLDPGRGAIASVIDKTSSRELVDKQAGYGFAQYVHEQFSAADMERFVKTYTKPTSNAIWGDFGKPNMPPVAELPHRTSTPRDARVRIERGPISATVILELAKSGALPYAAALTVTLYDDQPYIDVGWRISEKGATPAPEAGWLAFPVAVGGPRFRLARLGAVIDPAADTVEGSNHDVYCLTGGAAVLDAKLAGVGICPIDSPLVSLDHPGLWEYHRRFASVKPAVFVNLYNNLWGTNFAQWSEGSWSSRVRVWSIPKYDPFGGVVRPSMEARTPLRGEVAGGAGGNLPASQAGLRLSRSGVAVTAWGRNPDGPGKLLRLWEQAGEDEAVQVCVAGAPAGEVQPVDLRGRASGKVLPLQNGCFTAELRRYAPASFLFSK